MQVATWKVHRSPPRLTARTAKKPSASVRSAGGSFATRTAPTTNRESEGLTSGSVGSMDYTNPATLAGRPVTAAA